MKKIFTILFLFITLNQSALAYDNFTTHPALTDEIVDYLNLLHPGSITPEQKEWLVQGSIEEDTIPRWINHFYDPVRKIGWSGENLGDVSPETLKIFSSFAFTLNKPVASVQWVNDEFLQQEYSRYGGNRTWKRGLKYYADGDLKEAYMTLGYVLHLIEDASVPEHTRNDTHAQEFSKITGDYGSPYEGYTRKWTRENLRVAEDLQKSGLTPPALNKIEDYIISLATYSNSRFFSKDTIDSQIYPEPKIVREDDIFGYGIDENNIQFPLVKIDFKTDNFKIQKEFSIKNIILIFLDISFNFSK